MRKIFTLAIIALSINAFAQNSSKTQVATKNLTIIGTIKNFSELVAVVIPDTTFFQLIPISSDGNISMLYDGKGLAGFGSDFPKLSVPKNAAFSFNIPNVPPGKYLLAVQCLNSKGSGKRAGFITGDGQQFFVIKVKPNSASPLTINIGNKTVMVH